MSSSINKLTDIAFPGIVVVALSVIGYYTTRPSLTSARPALSSSTYTAKAPRAPQGLAAIHARIWEDPLLTYKGKEPDTKGTCGAEPAQVAQILKNRVENAGQFTCLAVLVPGGPDEGAIELRLRIRYALVSALTQSGFSLKYNSRLTYTDLDGIVVKTGGLDSNVPTPPRKVRVPFKLYVKDTASNCRDNNRNDRKQHRVLVCWIDELVLGERPLDALHQIMSKLFPEALSVRDKVGLRIIGPTSSDMLETMSHEKKLKWPEWGKQKPQLWSTRATRATVGNEHDLFLGKGIEFRRAIGTDDELQRALRWELALRDAWPAPHTDEKIVIVTEIDTSYGRAWTHEGHPFQDRPQARKVEELTVKTSQIEPVPVRLPPPLEPKQLIVFSYLRGIDGRTFHTAPKKDSCSEEQQTAASSTRLAMSSKSEPQTGPAQLDYLRRLEREVTLLHDPDAIKAIGVIGTDVYDKLLILRALRPHFPNAVFFTTDLDIELSHPAELPWTRNLVVASHFGLTTRALEGSCGTVNQPAPFRDSYQTALFHAVQLAVAPKATGTRKEAAQGGATPITDREEVSQEAQIDPANQEHPYQDGCLLFEIGTNGPFHLATLNAVSDKHPPTSHARMSLSKTMQQILVVVLLLLVPYWAGIRFMVHFVELFKRAWKPSHGIFAKVIEFIERSLARSATRFCTGSFRRMRCCLSAILFVSVCGAISILMFNWSVTLLILIGLLAAIVFIAGARPSTRWDVYFFAFAGTIVLALILRRYTFVEEGTMWSWVMGCGVAGCMVVGITMSEPLRIRALLFGRHLHAMLRANLVGHRTSSMSRAQKEFHDSDTITPYWIIVLATLVVVATVIAMILDQLAVTGEPFTAAGISMWPVTLCRAGLFLAACTFIVICVSSLAQSAARLEKEYLGQYSPLTTVPPVWRQFFGRRFLRGNAHSAMPMVWAFFAGSYLFFAITSFPSNPSRGRLCLVTSQAVMYCTVISMSLLSFVVFEAVQSVRACVKALKEQLEKDSPTCPDNMLAGQAQQWHISLHGALRPAIEGLTIVRLLAERTRTVGKLLLLPAWIVLGTALIRLSWLDNLGVSWQLLLVLSILVFFPVAFYARLRLEVHRVRDQISGKLVRLKSALTANGDSAEIGQLAILNDAIVEESRGAFSPMTRDPIFQALSIPFGGAGGVMLVQDILSNL